MNKDEALKKINESDSGDFEVFLADEHKTYLDNFAKQTLDTKVAEEVKKIHQSYDNDLYDLFGEHKQTNEKTYNFLKRKVTEVSEKAKAADEYKSKIDELTEALKKNSGDEQLKNELKSVKEAYELEKKSWNQKESEFTTKMDRFKLDSELEKGLASMKFKDDLPESVRRVFIQNVKNDLISSAKIIDGKMIFVDENGQTLVNKDNALNPFTPAEMLSNKLSDILAEAKPGTPPKPEKKYVDGKEVLVLTNPHAKTREEVTQYLRENGITNSSKEYREMYAEFTKDLPKYR